MKDRTPAVAVIIAAAGSSTRMGADMDKQFVRVGGRPLLWHSVQQLSKVPGVRQILVTVSPSNEARVKDLLRETLRDIPWMVVRGGSERQHSIRNAALLTEASADLVLVHDGARPFVDPGTIRRSLDAAAQHGAAIVAVPVKDTIKEADSSEVVAKTLDRRFLWQVQTPQVFRRELLLKAHEQAEADGILATDDAALVERIGASVHLVRGSHLNLKVTTPEDVLLAEAVAAGKEERLMQRVGIGYDVHCFVPGRPLMIGGVEIPHPRGLEGHSDADVLLHAIADALLGAAGMGDIGRHFPDTDPRFKGISSLILLGEVRKILDAAGYAVYNVDAVVEAQEPKLAPFISAMNARIAAELGIGTEYVNVKATTTEGLGFVGRKEGIAAQAVTLVVSK